MLRKEAARRFVIDRLEFFSNKYTLLDQSNIESLKYKRISIRNQRSRWGSCSSRKNLNFNYKIIDLAPELQDYIIVHELCHLKELHHGKAFWDLMKLTIPQAEEYHQIVRKIRTIE